MSIEASAICNHHENNIVNFEINKNQMIKLHVVIAACVVGNTGGVWHEWSLRLMHFQLKKIPLRVACKLHVYSNRLRFHLPGILL